MTSTAGLLTGGCLCGAVRDDPEAVPPQDHTFVDSQLSGVRLDDGLPRHPQARP